VTAKSDRLSVLSDAEQEALYGMPDFDDGQQLEYLSLSEIELALACSRPGLPAQAYCAMQIGYFKAKHTFFRFTWNDARDDRAFVLSLVAVHADNGSELWRHPAGYRGMSNLTVDDETLYVTCHQGVGRWTVRAVHISDGVPAW